MSEWLMRDNDIPECDCSHQPEVEQVPDTQLPKLRIEVGILHAIVMKNYCS